jgi:hypothetical protein
MSACLVGPLCRMRTWEVPRAIQNQSCVWVQLWILSRIGAFEVEFHDALLSHNWSFWGRAYRYQSENTNVKVQMLSKQYCCGGLTWGIIFVLLQSFLESFYSLPITEEATTHGSHIQNGQGKLSLGYPRPKTREAADQRYHWIGGNFSETWARCKRREIL